MAVVAFWPIPWLPVRRTMRSREKVFSFISKSIVHKSGLVEALQTFDGVTEFNTELFGLLDEMEQESLCVLVATLRLNDCEHFAAQAFDLRLERFDLFHKTFEAVKLLVSQGFCSLFHQIGERVGQMFKRLERC